MILSERTRANTKHSIDGPGGRHCACCAESPKNNKRIRRSMRRIEKQNWKNNADL